MNLPIPPKADILVVDDSPENVFILSSMLSKSGYHVRQAQNGDQAIAAVQTLIPDLIVLDINMPDLNGYEVCTILKRGEATQNIPIIFISALDEISDKVKAFRVGGDDYISKPFHIEEVLARIETHLTLKRLLAQTRQTNTELRVQVDNQVKQILNSHLATIFALAKLAEFRDPETGQHLERVREYCRTIAEELSHDPAYQSQVDAEYVNAIYQASPLHDIGKVGVPDYILLKPDRLTEEEFETMKKHTLIGAASLREVDQQHPGNPIIRMGIQVAESHHEHWDGNGYPYGLAGEQIPLAARIIALADVYDAIITRRIYKGHFSHETARNYILDEKEKQFDPNIVDCFMRLQTQFQNVKEQIR